MSNIGQRHENCLWESKNWGTLGLVGSSWNNTPQPLGLAARELLQGRLQKWGRMHRCRSPLARACENIFITADMKTFCTASSVNINEPLLDKQATPPSSHWENQSHSNQSASAVSLWGRASMGRGLNDVKHGTAPAKGTRTGHVNVCIYYLHSALLLISKPGLKLTGTTIILHKRARICCLSCRVEMGLCVCTHSAVMRSSSVQRTKWNPNKRSHFTLTTDDDFRLNQHIAISHNITTAWS